MNEIFETSDTLSKKIAEYIYNRAKTGTSNGSWFVSFEEIAHAFEIAEETAKRFTLTIINYLWDVEDGEAVAECESEPDGISLVLYLSYCDEWDGTEDWGC